MDNKLKGENDMTNTRENNQRVLNKLVGREVIQNVSYLVDHFMKNPEALQGSDYSYDDLLEIAQVPDYETSIQNWMHDIDKSELEEFCQDNDIDDLNEYIEDIGGEEFCQDNDIEIVYREVLEHWVVTDYFGRKLQEHGEAVMELFNLTIWGRTTSGQAILLDRVIEDIGEEMEILEGQTNHKYWLKA